jgi:hypothetical protein
MLHEAMLADKNVALSVHHMKSEVTECTVAVALALRLFGKTVLLPKMDRAGA